MRYGAIDVGTNSCRMLVLEVAGENYRPLEVGIEITRLGEGVDQNKLLRPGAIARTAQAIITFYQQMEKLGVKKLAIVGTSALRDVHNSQELTRLVQQETGQQLQVISGEKEARLVYTGASIDLTGSNFLVIDIGGGSTEFIWQQEGSLKFKSLNMGSVRMTERFIKEPAAPLKPGKLEIVEEEVAGLLEQELELVPGSFKAVGVGGTITTLGAIDLEMEDYDQERLHLYSLSLAQVKDILARLSRLSLEERKKVAGLHPGRADIIIAGNIILKTIMERLGLREITISEHGILFGVIKELHSSGKLMP